MRIGIDAKRMLNNPTGLGNYARILFRALSRDFPENEYLLFSPGAKEEFLNSLAGTYSLHLPPTKMKDGLPAFWRPYYLLNNFSSSRLLQPLWRSFFVSDDLKAAKVQVYHGMSNELPFGIHRSGIASVVTIHDLIFLKHKEQYPWADRQIYDFKTRYAARHADRIIAVSEETKRDLMEYYGIPESKISVIYQSVEEGFLKAQPPEILNAVKQKFNLPGKYILHVGSFFPRKNQLGLIEAFDKIRNLIEEDLVLVGNSGFMLAEVRKSVERKKLRDRVHILTNAQSEDMPALYQLAELFVFPSLFEGFGIPVLEAHFSHVPVIAGKGGAIEEAAGPSAFYIDASEPEDIAEKILTVLKDSQLRQQMIASGIIHTLTMTDTKFAAKTMEVYRSIQKTL